MTAHSTLNGILVAAGLTGLVRFVVAAAETPGIVGALIALAAATLCAAAAWLGWFDLERGRLLAESRGRLLGHGEGSTPAPGWRLASRLGVLFLVASLAVGAALEGTLRVPPAAHGPRTTPADQRREVNGSPESLETGDGAPGDSTAFQPAIPVGPSGAAAPGLSPEAFPALYSTRTVLEIEELDADAGGRPTSMHLRAFTMDRYGPGGAPVERTSADPSPLPAAGPRGLRVINPFQEPIAAPGAALARRRLEVRFVEAPNGVVFSPRRLARLDAGDVLWDVDATLLRLADRRQRRYRMTVEEPRISPQEFRTAPARGSLPGAAHLVALPPMKSPAEASALSRLAELAAGWSEGARSDAARVMAVVTRLRTDHGYLLQDTRFTGPGQCLAVLERGAGSCTQFASTAMVMLRSLGMPTRIAVGYLVTATTDDDADTWVARECDGHAWIEVHFEGLGWLTFDPTPADDLGGGALSGWGPVEDDGSLDPAPRSPFGAVAARTLGWLKGAEGGGKRGLAWTLVIVAAVAMAWAAASRWLHGWRARSGAAGDRINGGADGAGSTEDHGNHGALPTVGVLGMELLAALARCGHTPSRNETTLAFGRRVDSLHPGGSDRVSRALTTLLRCSCKGVTLAPADERSIEALCRDLVAARGS